MLAVTVTVTPVLAEQSPAEQSPSLAKATTAQTANPATSAPATAPGNQPGSMNARPAATAQPGSVKPGDKKAAA
ncbi:MAG TPA: hypothetical protein V6C72_17120, partial [Chroococcales cyanobacterium]